MILFNRILNVLILVLALVSAAYSGLLFQRRVELRDRGEKLADAVAVVAKDLDENSGTAYSKDITRELVKGEKGEDLDGGKLGWAYYHSVRDPESKSYPKFDALLSKFKEQAIAIRAQRDRLATAVNEHATLFQQPSEPAAIQNVASYEEAVTNVHKGLEGIRKRDDEIFSKIESTANQIGVAITKDELMDIANYEKPLNTLSVTVSKTKERSENYVDTLQEAVQKIDAHDFEVNPQSLRDEEGYIAALAAIRNDFGNINQKLKDYEQHKVQFLVAKDELERTRAALESANANQAALESKMASMESQFAAMKRKYDRLMDETSTTQTSQLNKIEGKVINVNYDWNYVIINLGKKDNLPESLEMIVAREQEFICKVLVSRVFENYSVAEILPKNQKGNAIEGDRVIF